MKKYLLPLIALMAMPIVFTACSDDDDKTQSVKITTGEIPSKNVFVTIDGSYVGRPDGATELTLAAGAADPSGTEQHLQLKCPSMFILTPGTDDTPLTKSVPTFDVTATTANGKTTLSGNYSGSGYEIALTGEVSVNHAGENDWKLNFEQKQTYFTKDTPYNGKTLEFDFSNDYILALDIWGEKTWSDELNAELNGGELMKTFFNRLPETIATNSGYSAARIVFGEGVYELWFKDAKTGEYVKDESEHRYLYNGDVFYFMDEPEFKKKQAEYFNLKPMGLNYTNTDMNFAQQKLAYEHGSSKEWCITTLRKYTPYNDKVRMALEGYLGAHSSFLDAWSNTTDKETSADKEFKQLQEWAHEGIVRFSPFILFDESK